jgi:hypothetical protein
MSDNQEEIISPEEAIFRDEVNCLIEKAYPGKGINEIIELKIKNKRGTYYRNVKKRPLSRKFSEMILRELKVDISVLNNTKTDTSQQVKNTNETPIVSIPLKEFQNMANDIRTLNKELQERLKSEIEHEIQVRELMLKINDLSNELEKLKSA